MAQIVFDPAFPEAKASLSIETADGGNYAASHDAGIATGDLGQQQMRLEEKFGALVNPVLGPDAAKALLDAINGLGRGTPIRELMALSEKHQ